MSPIACPKKREGVCNGQKRGRRLLYPREDRHELEGGHLDDLLLRQTEPAIG